MASPLARIGAALKSALSWSAYGGQGISRGTIADWVNWHGAQPWNHVEAAGELHKSGVVMACCAYLMRSFPEPPIQVVREEPETGEENEVPRHPLTMALRRPNDYYGPDCLWQRVVFDRALHGQAYLYKERNAAGRIIALWHVPQQRLIPQWDTSGKQFISFYLFKLDQREERIPTTDLVHFRFGADPNNERAGLPVLGAALREVAQLNEGANYRGAILKNMGVPSHLLQARDPARPITADQAKELHALWQERVSGANRGKPIIPNWALEAVKIGMSPAELDLGTMNYENVDLICSLFGLPAQVVGFSSGSAHKTYNNMRECKELATEGRLVPDWHQVEQELTLQLLPDYSTDEQESVRFDLTNVRALQEDQSALWTRTDTAVTHGWISRNEGRAIVNLPAFIDSQSVRTVGGKQISDYDIPAPLTASGYVLPGEEPEPAAPESGGDRTAAAAGGPQAAKPETPGAAGAGVSTNGNGRQPQQA